MLTTLLLLDLAQPRAWAGPVPDAETFITTYRSEPPNVLFVLDLSGNLEQDCGGVTCMSAAKSAIQDVVARTDWAYFGVVGTTPETTQSWYTRVVPLGSSSEVVAAAVDSVASNYTGANNLAEVLADVSRYYLALYDDPGSFYAAPDFDEGPICADCQSTHVVVLTGGRPTHDRYPISPIPGTADLGWDVTCDVDGILSVGYDTGCLYDNIVRLLYKRDHRLDRAGTQRVVTHTVSLNLDSSLNSGLADDLFWSAAEKTLWNGWYWETETQDELQRALAEVLEDVHRSLVGSSAPTLEASGDLALYAYAESLAYVPLARGHLRAFELGQNPSDPGTFGQVVYDSSSPVGGARWDAGELLSLRPVSAGEQNEGDQDGAGRRDIYTFLPELAAMSLGAPGVLEAREAGRFAFDRTLVELAASSPPVLDLFVPVGETGEAHPWDLDGDAQVDQDDLQQLVDFVRGVEDIPFRYLSQARGSWRLGDAPRAVPAVLRAQNRSYGADPAYRRFLSALEWASYPDVALLAANDGMLHAFDLDSGEELWAWVPAQLLYRERQQPGEGRLVDLLWSGRPHLLEGSPVVEDIWIDDNGDGIKQCTAVPDDCEWRRVAVVSQGRGGPAVLALDITVPTSPRFLWEQVDPDHADGTGYGPRQPVVVSLLDDDTERWTTLWGTGHARTRQESPALARLAEPVLYMRALEDSYDSLPQPTYASHASAGRFSAGGMVHHPSAAALDVDADGRPEGAWLAGAPAAVDVDDDGTADVLYVHLSDGATAKTRTKLYKVLLGSDPEAATWCALYDASEEVGEPLESFYSPTVSWMDDGSLGIYWGSGSPFDGNTTTTGRFFAIRDPDPLSCSTAQPICGADGSISLGIGTRLTDDPVVYNGTVYFPTWTTDAKGCGAGSGRIYGLTFDSCQAAMPDPYDDEHTVSFVSVNNYPSTIALSDQGTLLYPGLPSSSAPVSVVDVHDPLHGTSLLSYALLNP